MDIDKINRKLNNIPVREIPRDYLGFSMIGNDCHRYLQLYHYWAFEWEIDSRIRRLFNFGHSAEEFMIEDLAKVGIIVNRNSKPLIGLAGHWRGHIDCESGTDLVEFKTHNDKSFKDLVKKGLNESKPSYYDQVTAYMGYGEYKGCIHLNYNKNTSEYYIEYIEFDEERFKELKRKEAEILLNPTLLPRIGNNNISWYKCKMCNAKRVCFFKEQAAINCRTCKYVDVLNYGKWKCNKHERELSIDEQRVGCKDYELSGVFKE